MAEAGADFASGGEMAAKISAETKVIAEALAGHDSSPHDGRPGSRASGGGTFTIADTDDLTALMLMVCIVFFHKDLMPI